MQFSEFVKTFFFLKHARMSLIIIFKRTTNKSKTNSSSVPASCPGSFSWSLSSPASPSSRPCSGSRWTSSSAFPSVLGRARYTRPAPCNWSRSCSGSGHVRPRPSSWTGAFPVWLPPVSCASVPRCTPTCSPGSSWPSSFQLVSQWSKRKKWGFFAFSLS